MSSRLSAGRRRLLAKHTPALLGMQSTAWGDSHMLPSSGVRVWVVCLTPKIERVISLLSASPVGEARCRCRKVWLTRIDYLFILSGGLAETLVEGEVAHVVQCMRQHPWIILHATCVRIPESAAPTRRCSHTAACKSPAYNLSGPPAPTTNPTTPLTSMTTAHTTETASRPTSHNQNVTITQAHACACAHPDKVSTAPALSPWQYLGCILPMLNRAELINPGCVGANHLPTSPHNYSGWWQGVWRPTTLG
jgi:hypothetical protein